MQQVLAMSMVFNIRSCDYRVMDTDEDGKMKQKYQIWINKYTQNHHNIRGMCAQATKEMAKEFPELKRVRGFVHHILSTKPSEHWWLKDIDDNIIDPTSKQFGGIIEYTEWDEEQEEPTGKCHNCGNYCYNGQATCSDRCAKEFAASLKPSTSL